MKAGQATAVSGRSTMGKPEQNIKVSKSRSQKKHQRRLSIHNRTGGALGATDNTLRLLNPSIKHNRVTYSHDCVNK